MVSWHSQSGHASRSRAASTTRQSRSAGRAAASQARSVSSRDAGWTALLWRRVAQAWSIPASMSSTAWASASLRQRRGGRDTAFTGRFCLGLTGPESGGPGPGPGGWATR